MSAGRSELTFFSFVKVVCFVSSPCVFYGSFLIAFASAVVRLCGDTALLDGVTRFGLKFMARAAQTGTYMTLDGRSCLGFWTGEIGGYRQWGIS